ncbi:MAG: hypothetical protein IH951_11625 [Bacteroidetes bacterium]|nr:hypothetical protein [Bacteroidota bacterium]
MKDHGLLFKAEMVRANLEGRKTETRRLVKKVDLELIEYICGRHGEDIQLDGSDLGQAWRSGPEGFGHYIWIKDYLEAGRVRLSAPYGGPGSRIYQKETWQATKWAHPSYEYPLEGSDVVSFATFVPKSAEDSRGDGYDHMPWHVVYAADGDWGCREDRDFPWQSPMFMPKWAARAWFEVLDVRVERIQDIDDAGAIAEGIESSTRNSHWGGIMHGSAKVCHARAWRAYQDLWDSINAKNGFPWKNNDWVRVIKYKRIENV